MKITSTPFRILSIFLLSFSLSYSPSLFGQTITEDMGAVKTDYLITSEDLNLELIDQIIIKRGEGTFYTGSEAVGEGGAGYGYGIGKETFHLELMSLNPVRERQTKNRWHSGMFLLQFYNTQNQLICNVMVPAKDVILTSEKENPLFYLYSINLARVPLVVLDHTNRINIVNLTNKR